MCIERFKSPLFLLLLVALFFAGRARADETNDVTLLWKFKFPDKEAGAESSCALAPDGTIYQGLFRGWLLAVSPDGKLKWKFKVGREIKSSPAIGTDGTIYFGSRDGNFYALSPAGKLKWKFATGGWMDGSPAIAEDGTIFFGSWNGNFYALAPDGKLKWKFAAGNLIFSSPAIAADGTVYFGSHDKNFYALAPDGVLKWMFQTKGEIDCSPAIAGDGTVYFASSDGNLFALRPDGGERWHFRTGGFTPSSPVLDSQGNVFLGAGRDIFAISHDGALIWRHPTEVPLDTSWALAGNGEVYLSMPWLRISGWGQKNHWPPTWSFQMTCNLSASPNLDPQGVVYASDGLNLFAIKPPDAAPLEKSSWPMWRANPQHTGRVQK